MRERAFAADPELALLGGRVLALPAAGERSFAVASRTSTERREFSRTKSVLFGIGVVKSLWTHRSWWSSGLEILVIGAFAGIAGYFFGSILPGLLGAPGVNA